MNLMRPKHWIFLGAITFSLTCVIWVVLSLRNDDSTLSVVTRYVTRYVKVKMGWSYDPFTVLARMAKYEERGRYDDAISTGVACAEKYPDSFTSGWIYRDISVLYLKKAKADGTRAEEYLRQAVLYRDKALRTASDSSYSLAQLVAVSLSIGDMSSAQRCVQYRNSMKLLDRMNLLVNEDKDRVARQFKPDPAERKKIEDISAWTDASIKQVETKISTAGCQ